MANLGGRELYSNAWKSALFIRKYTNGEPFALTSGKNVVFVPDQSVVKLVTSKGSVSGVKLLDAKGTNYTFGNLAKTMEFGSKMIWAAPSAQDFPIVRGVYDAIDEAKMLQASGFINLVIGHGTFQIASVRPVPKSYLSAKANIEFLDLNGVPVAWVHHKPKMLPKDFQQWSGVSKKREPVIHAHKEVQEFLYDLKDQFPGGLPRRTAVHRKIKDPKLINRALFGQLFGGALSQENVTALALGKLRIVRRSIDTFELMAQEIFFNSSQAPSKVPGFLPVLHARNKFDADQDPAFMEAFKGDRSDPNFGNRIVIAPINGQRSVEFTV